MTDLLYPSVKIYIRDIYESSSIALTFINRL